MPTMSRFIIWESWRHIMLWLCFCIVHVLCLLTSCVQGCGLSTVNKVLFDWFYWLSDNNDAFTLDVIIVMCCCCSCTSCTSSSWGCTWCIRHNRCLHPDDADECAENTVTDKKVMLTWCCSGKYNFKVQIINTKSRLGDFPVYIGHSNSHERIRIVLMSTRR